MLFKKNIFTALMREGRIRLPQSIIVTLFLGFLSSSAFAQGSWTLTNDMSIVRVSHTASWLDGSNEILVAGGRTAGSSNVASAEIYNPQSGTWRNTGSLNTARQRHISARLPGGKILVAGGQIGSTALSSAEIFDPNTGTWSFTNGMTTARTGATAIELDDGRVLVLSGRSQATFGLSLSSAEVYDPSTGLWKSVGSSGARRGGAAVSRIAGGRILVTGGHDGSTFLSTTTPSARIFNPLNDSWTTVAPMQSSRFGHSQTTLSDGRVLVAGGAVGDYGGTPIASAELFNPNTGVWTSVGSLAMARSGHSAALLANGKVLVAGGGDINGAFDTAELFDINAQAFSPAPRMNTARTGHITMTLKPSLDVLVAGGWVAIGNPGTSSVEIYSP